MTKKKQPEDVSPEEQDSSIDNAITALEADVYILSGQISRAIDGRLRQAVSNRRRHEHHCVLVLTTLGGDAHAAYLIARFLKRVYGRVTACVFGYCKSAGTLLALGCHEVAMGIQGELGPLDVQLSR